MTDCIQSTTGRGKWSKYSKIIYFLRTAAQGNGVHIHVASGGKDIDSRICFMRM